jgi:pyridoxal phosphate enzyme (YggS family)
MAEAAARAGRPASAVRLVGATKTVSADVVLKAAAFGLTDVGENRVQEAEVKRPQLRGATLTHHFIGQLQTNKARRAVELFDVIQSVDRLKLAQSLDRVAAELGKRQRCLIEVKISDDAQKGGVAPVGLPTLIEAMGRLPHLSLEGLMGVAPFDVPPEETRAAFRRLATLFERHRASFGDRPILSMGMSEDFECAIEEGSTMVRIGRALFGERTRHGAG